MYSVCLKYIAPASLHASSNALLNLGQQEPSLAPLLRATGSEHQEYEERQYQKKNQIIFLLFIFLDLFEIKPMTRR